MDNYELAFRMQLQVPETLDLSKEDEKTKRLYASRGARSTARRCSPRQRAAG